MVDRRVIAHDADAGAAQAVRLEEDVRTQAHGAAGDRRHTSHYDAGDQTVCRYWCTMLTVAEPSPTAEATRLLEP